ncbi:MAG: hypothetical protein A3H35_14380 [Betaproteobacteria bacterium RIFCSPLOWO2_02_FULL_62_17]|nr:MAG: hypothetical protein A3H35_14380 [Betaproteobacteria bacterium RIFCSPLOWO2_02_FULL_62_17]
MPDLEKIPHRAGAAAALVLSVAVTVILYLIPYGEYAAWPLLLLSTLAHELGHGLTALAVGGSFESFHLWADGSGMARYSGASGRFARAAVSAGGLVGPAVLAMLLFLAGHRGDWSRVALVTLGAGLLIAELLVVGNLFAWVFVGAVAAALLGIGLKANGALAQLAAVFLAIQLSLAVFSRGDYLFTATAQTAQGSGPSDVAQIAQMLFLPYWFWGALIALLSAAILCFGLWSFLRAQRP